LRKAHLFFLFLVCCLAVIAGLVLWSREELTSFSRLAPNLRATTSGLKLTDMAFSNDARYTRNPSQADLFTAFQDYPGSIEHFPSGSVVAPPDFSGLRTTIVVRR
jgi:hypothetical protein